MQKYRSVSRDYSAALDVSSTRRNLKLRSNKMPHSMSMCEQLHEQLKNTPATRDSLYTLYRAVFMKLAITTPLLAFFLAHLFAAHFFYANEFPRKSPEDRKCGSATVYSIRNFSIPGFSFVFHFDHFMLFTAIGIIAIISSFTSQSSFNY